MNEMLRHVLDMPKIKIANILSKKHGAPNIRNKKSKGACDGENEPKFLSLDHINGDGYRHRKNIRQDGHSLYHWIRKNDYPAGFQLLCHNCNMAKGLYGECPHKTGARR